jgi:hypothetical protein
MQMTARTIEYPLGERHLLPVSALAARLACVGWIDFDNDSASLFRFARELLKECRPRGICNAFRKTMIVYHTINGQVLDADHAKMIDNLTAILMGEVLTPELDTLMNAGYYLTVLPAFWGPFGKLRMLALDLSQCFLFLAKEPRILDLFSSREGGKGFEPYVNTHLERALWQPFRFTFYREGDIPLAGTAFVDGTGLDLSLDLTVVDHLHAANLGEADPVVMRDTKATLGEGEAIVAVLATKTREAGFFSALTSPEEGFESQIDADGNVLQDLGMNCFEGGTLFFQSRIGGLLLIARQAFPGLLIGILARFKQMIVEPSALLKGCLKLLQLLLCWINSVLKVFDHVASLADFKQIVKCSLKSCGVVLSHSTQPARKERRFHPPLERRGLSRAGFVNMQKG